MSNGSPTAFLLWAILACIFLAFLLLHLWAYDRFNCLKWDSGRQPGAFKRVMTYSYIGTLPLLVVFGVAMTVFKFKAGYVMMADGSIAPRPLELWATGDKHWLLPLYFVLSTGWSLELVTHLEELAFWLFLLHQGPGKREWFESWEFRIWYLGSMVSVLGMPLVTLVTRREIERVLPWIFLAGASAGTTTTVCFLYVLARFPGFILYVKDGGAEPDVVVRLATFYQLNRIRVIFRFMFTVPLLMIGIDALSGPYPIIGNPFAVDFLLMMGGIGCFISSAITLLIFFPRSITQEAGYGAKAVSSSASAAKVPSMTSPQNYYPQEGDQSSPKMHYGDPNQAAMQMGSFRYPNDPTDHDVAEYSRYAMSSAPRIARSADSGGELSPGYDSDAESFGMAPSPTLPFHQRSLRRPDMPTGTSRPDSGGRSDDTVWERPDEYPFPHTQGLAEPLPTSSLKTRKRPRSDGPFVYNSEGVVVSTIPALPNNSSRTTYESQSNGGPRQSNRERESLPSHLHPYLVNFTSPIDLLDDSPPQQVEEWQPPHAV